MKVYLSGPMTGYENYNFAAFHAAADDLRRRGYIVYSPAEMDEAEGVEPSPTGELPDPADYAQFLARDIQLIADEGIEAIVVLPGWEDSGGAKTEVAFGRALKLPILSYPVLYDIDRFEEAAASSFAAEAELDEAAGADQLAPDFTPAQVAVIEGIHDDLIQEHVEYRPEPTSVQLAPDFTEKEITTLWGLPVSYDHNLRPGEYRLTFPDRPPARRSALTDVEDAPDSGEVRVTDPDTGGQKGQKPERMDLLPVEFLLELSRVYGEGAKKYDDFNYLKGYDWKLSQGALLRHYAAWATGESIDPETGCHHLAHAAWHCATLFLFERYSLGKPNTLHHRLQKGEDA